MNAFQSLATPVGSRATSEPVHDTAETSGSRGSASVPLTLMGAMKCVRHTVAEFSDLPIDAIVSCERSEIGWDAVVDLLEAPARLGDNDMLGTYRVALTATGEPIGFTRERRYRREERGA